MYAAAWSPIPAPYSDGNFPGIHVRVNSGKVHNDTNGAATNSVVINADILQVVTGEISVTVGNAVVPCKSLLTICYLLRAC